MDANSTSTKKRFSALATLPILAVAIIGIAAGIFFSLKMSQRDAVSAGMSDAELAEVQDALVNSSVFPENFKTMPAFSLLTGENEAVDETLFDGKWSVVFFGYTHCPDVCPITLSTMSAVNAQLESEQVPVPQVVFITVDPNRDTVEKMQQYVNYFSESFIGISGELADIQKVTGPLGIVASFTANDTDPENYIVDHTASLLLIDPMRRVRAKINPPHIVENIVDDYKTLTDRLATTVPN